MAIQWAQEAWKEVARTTIKFFFEKCRVVKSNDDLMVEEDDLELKRLLSPNILAAEYVYFDADIPKSELTIIEHEVDWRERLREDFINAIKTHSTVSEETQEI